MCSPWATLSFLALACMALAIPVADPQNLGVGAPLLHHDGARPGVHAGSVGGARVKATLAQRSPQDLSALLSSLFPPNPNGSSGEDDESPPPAALPIIPPNSIVSRSPQDLGDLLDDIMDGLDNLGDHIDDRSSQTPSTGASSVRTQTNTNTPALPAQGVVARSPQGLTSILEKLLPQQASPAASGDGDSDSDSDSDSDTDSDSESESGPVRRAPQLDKIAGLITNICPPPPPPSDSRRRRWIVDTNVASEASARTNTDSAMIPRQVVVPTKNHLNDHHGDHHDHHDHHGDHHVDHHDNHDNHDHHDNHHDNHDNHHGDHHGDHHRGRHGLSLDQAASIRHAIQDHIVVQGGIRGRPRSGVAARVHPGPVDLAVAAKRN